MKADMYSKSLASLLLTVTFANPLLGAGAVTRAESRSAIPQEISKPITSDGLIGETLQVAHEGKIFETKTPESVGRVELSETKEALFSIQGVNTGWLVRLEF